MKYINLALLFIGMLFLSCKKENLSDIPEGQECKNGIALDFYLCNNVDVYAILTPEELNGTRLNDIWGWTDPETNKEYALVGLTDGVTFVDISSPANPVVIGKLDESNISAKYKVLSDPNYEACKIGIGDTEYAKSLTEGSTWRDHKVFNNHLFIGSDAQPHGIQVFDLTKLREYNGEMLELTHDALYDGLANSHNVIINEDTGFLYAAGATNGSVCDEGGLHILDINDPKNPQFVGCYNDTQAPRRRAESAYIHDAQCVTYSGPDSEHSGKEVCFNAAERSIVIADVTAKDDIKTLGFATEPNMYYAHQGWLTEDHSYFLMNDELDEINLGRNTRTYIFDVRNLDEPVFVDYFEHSSSSIDHNLYVKDDYVFATNYNSGLRILKMNDISEADLRTVAFFDTQPNTDEIGFDGTWSSYPYFESGVVIVSDIASGLFILRPNL